MTCLQRTPALRLLSVGLESGGRIGVGFVLRALVPTAIASSALTHTLTGATGFTTNPASPVNGTVGEELAVAFAFTGSTATPESYSIVGDLPPGLSVPDATGSPGDLTLNGTSGSVSGTPTVAGNYSVTLTAYDSPNLGLGANGKSNPFTLEFAIEAAANAAPSFTQQPQNLTVDFGGAATFTVEVAGSPEPTLQWRKDSEAIAGATAASLTLTSVTLEDAGSYDCVATNSEGEATSTAVSLEVDPPDAPVINSQPTAMKSRTGSGAFFSVQASGLTLSYQWTKDGIEIPDANASTLFLDEVQSADAGDYACVISNPGGSVTSTAVALTVVGTGSVRLANLSTRARVGVGGDILIPGFVIGGSGTKHLLVRAVGPRLGMDPFNVGGVLADPTMSVFSGGTSIDSNDDWGLAPDQAALADATAQVGAFSLDGSTQDAALLVALTPGPYTVQASGVGQTTGVGLVELYDTDELGSSARLVNLSARAQVGTGGDILIPGFVIEGDVAMTLLIRGVGPTLGEPPFNVGNVLPDPVMTVFKGGTPIAVNDDWEQAPNVAAILSTTSATGAFPLASGSLDSAFLLSLSPGAYTVQLAGKNGVTGVALIELYLVGP